MIMQDMVTPEERLNLKFPVLIEYRGYECMGCGETAEQIAESDGWTDDDFENNSRRTIEGNWYCHIDCFRDSR